MGKEQGRVERRLGREGEGMGEGDEEEEEGESAFQEAQVVCGYRWLSGHPPAISIFSCLRKLEYLPQAGSLSISLFRFTEEGRTIGEVQLTARTQSMSSTQTHQEAHTSITAATIPYVLKQHQLINADLTSFQPIPNTWTHTIRLWSWSASECSEGDFRAGLPQATDASCGHHSSLSPKM